MRKRVAVEFGMGTDLRGEDYTKASVRALRDALWHNALSMHEAFGFPPESMIVEVRIGVQSPELVDRDAVAAVLPYGMSEVVVVKGGLDIEKPGGQGRTLIAQAACSVFFDMIDNQAEAKA